MFMENDRFSLGFYARSLATRLTFMSISVGPDSNTEPLFRSFTENSGRVIRVYYECLTRSRNGARRCSYEFFISPLRTPPKLGYDIQSTNSLTILYTDLSKIRRTNLLKTETSVSIADLFIRFNRIYTRCSLLCFL